MEKHPQNYEDLQNQLTRLLIDVCRKNYSKDPEYGYFNEYPEDEDAEDDEESCEHHIHFYSGDVQQTALYRKIGRVEQMVENAMGNLPVVNDNDVGQDLENILKYLKENF